METGYQKEETKRLRIQLSDLRSKLGDLESRVRKRLLLPESLRLDCLTFQLPELTVGEASPRANLSTGR